MPALLGLLVLAGCSEAPPSGWAGYAEGDYVYLAAPVAGQLVELAVAPGAQVEAGALLFRLDASASHAARAEAEARLDIARAQAANSAKGRRPDELAVTRAQLAQARSQAERTESELRRQQALVAQDYVSQSRLDEARSAAAQARERVTELEAALRVALLPARGDEQAAAQAGVAAAAQAQIQALWREQQAEQRAPQAALVADSYFRVGEYVPAGQPVLALLAPAARKAVFHVSEAELGSLALGQRVRLHCDGCASPLAARISRIATRPEYTPPVIYSNAQRARLVFQVEARPEPADALRLQPGQPLDVRRDGAAGPAASAAAAS